MATKSEKKKDAVRTITFEEVMFSIMAATQDTFKNYMDIDIFSGKVEQKVHPIDSDVIGIVGVAGDRVGYIIFSTNRKTAILIARKLTMTDDPDEDTIRDAVGELANNIAGMFKSKYHEQYGGVYLGLPLVVAGNIRPFGGESKAPAEAPAAGAEGAMVRVQTKGVTIPFKSFDGEIYFQVMVYI